MKFSFYLLALILVGFCGNLTAANISYVGSQAGYWSVASNWSTGTVPTANDNVTVDCNCDITIYYAGAVARTLTVAAGSTATVSPNGSLDMPAASGTAITVYGGMRNYGMLSIEKSGSSTFVGISIQTNGYYNNQGNTEIANCWTSIRNYGRLYNAEEIFLGSTSYSGQVYGLVNFSGSTTWNFPSAEIRIAATENTALISLATSTYYNYGKLRIESSTQNQGFLNEGMLINSGRLEFRGRGLINSGELTNSGTIRCYSSGTGIAVMNQNGSFLNLATGIIDIWGYNYSGGFEASGSSHTVVNAGYLNVFTGYNTNCIHFSWNTNFENTATGRILARTYGNHAMSFYGDLFENNGGHVQLDAYGANKQSLYIASYGTEVINSNCGTMLLRDRVRVDGSGSLINDAWIEYTSGQAPILGGSNNIVNSGVIQDPEGSLGSVINNINNDEGVIITAPYQPITFGSPYTSLIYAGSSTDVEINDEVTDGSSLIVGSYTDSPQPAVFFDANTYNDPKYFYVETRIPGCDTRKYNVYNNIPPPFAGPGSSNSLRPTNPNFGEIQELTVYPNPVIDELNVILPSSLEGEVSVELMDITGRRITAGDYSTGSGTLKVERPGNLSAGTYLLTVRSRQGGFLETRRVTFSN